MEKRLNWKKSSYSGAPTNECVECAEALRGVLVRDSKRPGDAVLTVAPEAWGAFARAVADGHLSRVGRLDR